MKNMKKLLTLLLALALVAVLAVGCSSSDDNDGKEDTTGVTDAGDTDDEDSGDKRRILFFAFQNIGDYGINDLGHQAAQILAEKYDMDLTLVEGGADDSTRKTILLDALETGNYDYCIAASWYIQDYLLEVVDTFDTQFVLYDTSPLSDYSDYPNVNGVSFRQNEGSFLAAIYQGLMNEKGHIGVAVNQDSPITNDFASGWIHGAKYYNDNYEPIKYTLGYMSDPTVQGDYETVNVLLDAGAESIYNIGGAVALGAVKAVDEHGGRDAGLFVVGVDYDQYGVYTETEEIDVQGAELFYTSMEKKITDMIVVNLSDVIDNDTAMGVNHSYTLAEGGVALTKNDHYKSVTPQEVQDEIEAVEAKIASGEIVVPSYFDFETYEDFAEYRDNPDARLD